MNVQVLKFGGTSIADAACIERVAAIVKNARSDTAATPIVVVSALAGITDLLGRALESVQGEDREPLEAILAEIERRHRWVVSHGVGDPSRRHHLNLVVDAAFEKLRSTMRSIRQLGELSPRARDGVLAAGEGLSGPIVCAVLQDHEIPAEWIDPRDWLTTDERFGCAEVDLTLSRTKARRTVEELVSRGRVPVTGGFVGASTTGETTTLGRGGSDTSAAYLAACLDARRLQIWTDVDGLMSADPRYVEDARPLARVGYEEAAELAHYGARVLHPACLAPVAAQGIPVEVRNTFSPDQPGTHIGHQRDSPEESADLKIVAVASRDRLTTLRVRHRGARMDHEFVPTVMRRCASRGFVSELLVASANEVHLVLPEEQCPRVIYSELTELGDVTRGDDRALVAVIGSALVHDSGCRANVMAAVARWDPDLVILGATETSLLAVLPRNVLSEAVRALHQQFFERIDA